MNKLKNTVKRSWLMYRHFTEAEHEDRLVDFTPWEDGDGDYYYYTISDRPEEHYHDWKVKGADETIREVVQEMKYLEERFTFLKNLFFDTLSKDCTFYKSDEDYRCGNPNTNSPSYTTKTSHCGPNFCPFREK